MQLVCLQSRQIKEFLEVIPVGRTEKFIAFSSVCVTFLRKVRRNKGFFFFNLGQTGIPRLFGFFLILCFCLPFCLFRLWRRHFFKHMERQSVIWRFTGLLVFYGDALLLDCLSDVYLPLSNLSPSVALKGLLCALNLF